MKMKERKRKEEEWNEKYQEQSRSLEKEEKRENRMTITKELDRNWLTLKKKHNIYEKRSNREKDQKKTRTRPG